MLPDYQCQCIVSKCRNRCYKWQAHEAIFVTKDGKKSCHQYIGKAGSPAYLKAVERLVHRTKIEGLEQALHPLELGLSDLVEEATRHQKD